MSTREAAPALFTRYGFTRTGDPDAPLEIRPYPHLCHAGVLRATVIASAVDLVGGFVTREVAGGDATFTTDLSIRIPRPGSPEMLVAKARPLRSGRRFVTTAVRLEADDGLHAYGESTFFRQPREGPARDPSELSTPQEIPFHPLERSLSEEVGVEVVEAGRGEVRLPLHPGLLNPEGALQGALVALVIECAALALAENDRGRPAALTALDLRYLAAATEGPVAGRARWLDSRTKEAIHVELQDEGRSKITSTALVHVADAAPRRDMLG